MTIEITPHQKRKMKEMVDEIIVNHGILKISDRQARVDGMNIEQLSKIAFRYYKMIFSGESPLDIGEITKPDTSYNSAAKQQANQQNCIGCNRELDDEDIKKRMPVCESCRQRIKIEYEILKDIFL